MSANAQQVGQENWQRAHTVTQQENKSFLHYLFISVDFSGGQIPGGGLDLRHTTMNSGLDILRRGRIEVVRDKGLLNPRAPIGGDGEEMTDDEREIGQPFSVGKRLEISHASDIAYMLASSPSYNEAGLMVVQSLTGIPEPVKNWVERVLLPDQVDSVFALHQQLQEFDFTRAVEFPDSPQWMGWRLASGIVPEALVQQVRRELMTSCAQGEKWIRSFYSDQISEMRQASVPGGKGGLSVVSDKLRLVSRELGLEPPDGLARQVNTTKMAAEAMHMAQGAALPQNLQLQMPPELIEMFKALLAQGYQVAPTGPPKQEEPIATASEESWSGTSVAPAPLVTEESEEETEQRLETGPAASLSEKAEAEEAFTGDDEPPATSKTPRRQRPGSNR